MSFNLMLEILLADRALTEVDDERIGSVSISCLRFFSLIGQLDGFVVAPTATFQSHA